MSRIGHNILMTDKGTSNRRGRRIGYARVSDQDQNQALQVEALKLAGCDVIYGDYGISGACVTRRSLDTLLRDLAEGDTLVVWKLDRLGRSTLHLLQLLEDLRQNKVDFIAITQGIDTTTAVGRLLYGQLAVFAEFEREQIAERTKAGMAAAKARGVHVGRPRAIPHDLTVLLRHRIEIGEASVDQLAEELNLSRQTIYRAVRLCCTNRLKDSLCESSVIAMRHEQLGPHEIQVQELVILQ